MAIKKPALDDVIRNANGELSKNLAIVRKLEAEALAEHQKALDSAFVNEFGETVALLEKRSAAYFSHRQNMSEEGLKAAQEELNLLKRRQVNKIIQGGFGIGKVIDKRKKELEELIRGASEQDEISKKRIAVPIKLSRTKYENEHNYEVLEILYPSHDGNGLLQQFDSAVADIFNRIAGIEYSNRAVKHKILSPKKEVNGNCTRISIEVSKPYDLKALLEAEVAKTELPGANVGIRIYESEEAEAHALDSGVSPGWRPLEMKEAADALGLSYTALTKMALRDPAISAKTYKIGVKKLFPPETVEFLKTYLKKKNRKKRGRKKKPEEKKPEEPAAEGHEPEQGIEAKIEAEPPEAPADAGISVDAKIEEYFRGYGTRMLEGKEVFSKKDAQAILKYSSRGSIDRLVNDGRIEAVKDGYFAFVTKESIVSFIEEHEFLPGFGWKKRKKKSKRGRILTFKDKLKVFKRQLIDGKTPVKAAESAGMPASIANKYARKYGVFSGKYVSAKYGSIDAVRNTPLPGCEFYSEKQEIRDSMLELIANNLSSPSNLYLLSLEGPNFMSYIDIAKRFGVKPRKSMVAEKGMKEYLAMRSFVQKCANIDCGQIFRGLNLEYGNMQDAVEGLEDRRFAFEVANLDYNGPINSEKLKTIEALFAKNLFAGEALVFVTLNNNEISRKRVKGGSEALGKEYKGGFGTDDQRAILGAHVERFAGKNNYIAAEISAKDYMAKATPMLHICYKVKKAR